MDVEFKPYVYKNSPEEIFEKIKKTKYKRIKKFRYLRNSNPENLKIPKIDLLPTTN
jgi:hypothetical protein